MAVVDTPERLNYFLGAAPRLEKAAFVAANAVVVGDVELGEKSSVWYQCVLRADINFIRVGAGTNLQDAVIVHLADDAPTIVGEYSTVGHRAILHGCKVGDETLIGMGATVLDHVEVGSRCIIGANSLVPRGMKIPEGSMVFGSPAKIVRILSVEERRSLRSWAEKYILVAAAHGRIDR